MPYCKGDDSQICRDCGALIADGYWPEHTRFHELYAPTKEHRYERLSKDARQLKAMVEFLGFDGVGDAQAPAEEPETATAPADPRDEPITALRVDLDRYRLAIARTRSIIARMVELPREPEVLPDDEAGRAYLRGWQDMRALVDKALLPDKGQD